MGYIGYVLERETLQVCIEFLNGLYRHPRTFSKERVEDCLVGC